MTRRSLLELFTYAAALPDFQIFAEDHTRHASAPPEPDYFRNYQPKFFEADDLSALRAFTEILIPSDETPGGREAHCAEFIDFLLHASDGYAPETQQAWRKALMDLRSAGFHNADSGGRAQIVFAISRPELDHTATHPAFEAYRLIKHETVFAYYTSRAGMIENLDYRGDSYNVSFPACTHPEHHAI